MLHQCYTPNPPSSKIGNEYSSQRVMLSQLLFFGTTGFLVTSLVNVQVAVCEKKKYALNRPEQTRMLSLGYKINPFHFPWSCVITYLHKNEEKYRHEPSLQYPVSMCSILTKLHIMTSLNNLNDWIADALDKDQLNEEGTEPKNDFYSKFFWQRLYDMVVWANLRRVTPTAAHTLSQERRFAHMWVPLTARAYQSPIASTENEYIYRDPQPDWKFNETVEYDITGVAASITIMQIRASKDGESNEWEFNDWVLPVPIFPFLPYDVYNKEKNNKKIFSRFTARIDKDWKTDIEAKPHWFGPCSIGSFGIDGVVDKKRETRFLMLQVALIPIFNCQEIFCQHDLWYCGRYPIQHYHMCFKSLTYPDVCKFDEGAALYCHWANRSVIGILSRAFDCGQAGLPGVYTSVGVLVEMYRRIMKREGYYTDLPNRGKGEEINQDKYSYTIQHAPPTPTPDDALPIPWSIAN